MDDDLEELVVSVRADTAGFAQDMAQMKREFDTGLVSGFETAGKVLERSLLGALRSGSLGFEDLRRVAISALDQIAAKLAHTAFSEIFAGIGGGGIGGLLAGLIGSPGRETGGLVAPDRPYVVGERGPELFVPANAGRIEPGHALGGTRNDVRVSINLAQPRGASVPTALQRSSRQVASAVRKALSR